MGPGLFFLELFKYRVHVVEGSIDVFFIFGSGKYDLATGEDQQHDLGALHSIDEAREDFRLVGTEAVVFVL